MRQKRQWPAFESTAHTIGTKGFRAAGYHEKLMAPAAYVATEPLSRTSSPKRARRAASKSKNYEDLASAADDDEYQEARDLDDDDEYRPVKLPLAAAVAASAGRLPPLPEPRVSVEVPPFATETPVTPLGSPMARGDSMFTFVANLGADRYPKCALLLSLPGAYSIDPRLTVLDQRRDCVQAMSTLMFAFASLERANLFGGHTPLPHLRPARVEAGHRAIAQFEKSMASSTSKGGAAPSAYFVVAIDVHSTNMQSAIVAQNSASLQFLGKVVADPSLSAADIMLRQLIPAKDVVHFGKHLFACINLFGRGEPLKLMCQVILAGNRTVVCELTMMAMDDAIVCVGGEV
jgi:hypothetical protein